MIVRPPYELSRRHGLPRFVTTPCAAGVCEKNYIQDTKILGSITLKTTKSGAGEQFLPLDCAATARRKGVLLSRNTYE